MQDHMSEELKHYGVLGMKWGVKRNPSKAYGRAVLKKKKLEERVVESRFAGTKMQYKAEKLRQKAKTEKKMEKANDKMLQANRLLLDAAKAEKKGQKWAKAMDKTFQNYKIKKIPEGNLKDGKNFVYRKIYGDDSYKLTEKPIKKAN